MIYHSHSVKEALEDLKVDENTGLSTEEAERRLNIYGKNQLTEKSQKSIFQKFLEQFKDFMVIVLIIAAAVSFLTTIIMKSGNLVEPIIILAIVVVNAALGVIQESRAEKALAALKNMSSPSAKVIRDGKLSVIDAKDLTRGDIIMLEAGDFIPADARLLEVTSLSCDESTLTGESVPVQKVLDGQEIDDIAPLGDRVNMVYSGCSVSYGTAKAVVTETGMYTEIGKIATMINETENSETPLKAKLARLGKALGTVSLVICAVIFLIGLISGPDAGQTWAEKLIELFMTSVSLAVAAIPEGLPAIVTIVLALGVQKMVKKNAIIKKLPAVETLGSASVICSDKTGTLTQNKMTVIKLWDGHSVYEKGSEEFSPNHKFLIKLGAICSDAKAEEKDGKTTEIGDPTETAILRSAINDFGISQYSITNHYPRVACLPFDSDRKLMTTVNMIEDKFFVIVKGAPDVVLSRCVAGKTENAEKINEQFGSEALRVLAVGIKQIDGIPASPTTDELESGLTFVGLIGMIDPPRKEAIQSVALCKKAGIRTVMITGDHITTASAIAKQIGILEDGQRAVSGTQLQQMTDDELLHEIESISVYARVAPEDKIRIVKAWQQKGHIVAMTGDGVNDAPALKAADIGCAMGITGTDVAKGAADMTLTDDNFATIVTAVKEGRGIFDNIKKTVHFLVSCNFGEILTVFFGMIFFGVSPLVAIQLLWVNLVTDSAPALAIGFEPTEDDVMERPPRDKKSSIFDGGMGLQSAIEGVIFAVITLFAYFYGNSIVGDNNHLYGNTFAFAVLCFSQIVHSHCVRSEHSLFKVGFFSNPKIWLATLVSVGLMLIVMLTPLRTIFELVSLTSDDWLVIAGLSVVPLVISEIKKAVIFLINKFKK